MGVPVALRMLLFRFLHPLWRLADFLIPKHPRYWAFSTHHLHGDRFIENQRAMFEHVKADPAIRKFVFYRGSCADFQIEDAVNYCVVRHGSLRALYCLARCKVVFLTHSISMDYAFRWGGRHFSVLKLALSRHVVVNLWHGIPLKRLLYAANEQTFRHTDRVPYRTRERKGYAGLIASSDIDSYAMSAMFYPLTYRQVWTTGLPRNDFLAMKEHRLPRYIRDSLEQVRRIRQEKKLVIYAPTYRQTAVSASASYYRFSDDEIRALKAVLRDNGAILGYRPHYFRNTSNYFNLDRYIDDELIFDMSQEVVPEFSALARECDLLVTDYSSVYIEAIYLGKPVICFGYDIEHYKAHEDGLLYDMDLVFPGPVVTRFDALTAAIEEALRAGQDQVSQAQATARKIFFKYGDADNARRVAEKVTALLQRT
jgi:CDP-glycerol glycerophosphotransferase (TagB/SpsB family)